MMSPSEYSRVLIFGKTADQIKEMIDKRTAKQVKYYDYDIYIDINGRVCYPIAHCPDCDYTFVGSEGSWYYNFCPACGQRLDWSIGNE